MAPSLTALISFSICASICMALVGFLCKETIIRKIGIYTLLVLGTVTVIRLFFPFEMPFAITIPLGGMYTSFVRMLREPILPIGGLDISPAQVVFSVWVIGSCVLLAKMLILNIRLKRMLKDNCYTDICADTINCFHQAKAGCGCEANVGLYQSPFVSGPFTMGIIKPQVFIPDIDLAEDHWKYVFSHEITHYMKGDIWTKTIIELLVIVYWWNPVVYFFRKQILLALEMRVDHSVTHSLTEREKLNYLEMISEVAKRTRENITGKRWLSLGIDGHVKSPLIKRANLILDASTEDTRTTQKKTVVSIVLSVAIAAISCLFVFEPYIVPDDSQQVSYTIPSENSYIIVNEDGCYDIYIDHAHLGYVEEIPDSFSNLRIYENGKVEN